MDTGFRLRFGGGSFPVNDKITEYLTATEYTHNWANLTGWTTTGVQVNSNRLYGITGGNPAATGRAFAVAAGETVKVTAEIENITGNAGTQYVGVSFGGANNGVNASLPDFAGVGIGSSTRRPVRWLGANFTGVTTGNVFLSADTFGNGTWRATVVVDPENISLVLQRQDGEVEYYETVPRSAAPNSGAITSIVVWNGATNGTSGSYVKAIGARKSLTPFVTKTNAAGTIEGNTGFTIQRNVTDQWRIQLPETLPAFSPVPIVVFMHQSNTGTVNSPLTEARMLPVTTALIAAGFVLVSAQDGGDRWGNQDSLDNYAELVAWVRSKVYGGKVLLFGPSMGGIPMFNSIAMRSIPGIAGAAGICPVCDLNAIYLNPTFTASMRTAYGASNDSEFYANSADFNPLGHTGSQFSGVGMRFYVGAPGTDTIVPREDHIDVFQPILNGYAREAGIVTDGSGHLQTEQYQPADLIDFFERCLEP